MRDDRAVIKRDMVPKFDEVGLRHQSDTTSRKDGAVLANLRAERAVEPDNVCGACDRAKDTAVPVTSVEKTRQREV